MSNILTVFNDHFIEFLNGYHTENVHNKFKEITNAKKCFICSDLQLDNDSSIFFRSLIAASERLIWSRPSKQEAIGVTFSTKLEA